MSVRFNKKTDWVSMWEQDRDSMLRIMVSNLKADLDAGYAAISASVARQASDIARFQQETENMACRLAFMDEDYAKRWCFDDLKRRGAIE